MLWLDLAAVNQMEERTVREHTPRGATVLRLTGSDVKPCGEATPEQWPPVLDAIDRMERQARRIDRQQGGGPCRRTSARSP